MDLIYNGSIPVLASGISVVAFQIRNDFSRKGVIASLSFSISVFFPYFFSGIINDNPFFFGIADDSR